MMPAYPWEELARLWDEQDFGGVHDWLGLRWNHLIQERAAGHNDRDARFLQGLAFAALAYHFTRNANQDGARLLADDALQRLAEYAPSYAGIAVEPLLAALCELRPLLEGLDTDALCPLQPFVHPQLVCEAYAS
jgi:predicted metal-dependent hydrolase